MLQGRNKVSTAWRGGGVGEILMHSWFMFNCFTVHKKKPHQIVINSSSFYIKENENIIESSAKKTQTTFLLHEQFLQGS